jgi:hypothetical protein
VTAGRAASAGRPGSTARVCAVVPHYGCEQWLDDALTSLRDQTRPLDAIVVVDDASQVPPTDVVGAHAGVTLVTTRENGGPYRAVQAVIDATDFDAYLFQDADDWSAPDRLAVLLAAADETGAELIGTHEIRVDEHGDVLAVPYPGDVNAALTESPGAYALLHPSSIIGRDLLARLGGFATGLRFSGDLELLDRAGHAATVRNVAHPAYYRRRRAGSLTTAPETGLRSTQRISLHRELSAMARWRHAQAKAGRPLDLRPLRTAPPAALEHLLGPRLGTYRAWSPGRTAPVPAPAATLAPAKPTARPVFVLGAPATGHAELAAMLGRHPQLALVPESRWLAKASSDLQQRVGESSSAPRNFGAVMGEALCALAVNGTGRRPVASGADVTGNADALAALMPEARFIHVTRDAPSVVGDLVAAPVDGGVFYTPATAWHAWVAGTKAALGAERSIGAERVLRVSYDELVNDPQGVLHRCLEHVGEQEDPACLRHLPRRPEGPAPEPPHELRSEIARVTEQLDRPVGGRWTGAPSAVRAAQAVPASLTDRFRRLLEDATPPGAVVAVVSKGDHRLLGVRERTAWHLPRQDDGTYAGYHPADSDDAVAHLEALAAQGATHLAIPATGLWWLSHYEGLRSHLDDRAHLAGYVDGVGAVYRLGEMVAAGDTGQAPHAAHAVRFVTAPAPALVGGRR